MEKPTESVISKQIEITMANLRKNRMEAYFVSDISGVADFVETLISEGDTVSIGGSETLRQSGVLERLRNGKYNFLDRYKPGLDNDGIHQVFHDSFSADAYLCSSNAITMNGELYNVDGNSNRVAAICYGPKSVIIVAGYNKIVPDMNSAVSRVKMIAAPMNSARLNCDTYCAKTGYCQGLHAGEMTAGCGSPGRICRNYVISATQPYPGRIKVILVGEPLGY